MARRPQHVTDAEREVLRALWDAGPATIRTLADRLYRGGATSEYATVQKLLERLEDKAATEGVDGRLAEDDGVVGRRTRPEKATVFTGTRSHAAPGQSCGAAQLGAHRSGGGVQQEEHGIGPAIGVKNSGLDQGLEQRCREMGIDTASEVGRRLLHLTKELIGFPRHLSQHVGGMVMTRGPLCELVPIENAAMADRTVVEWDKDDLEELGILKVDCLCLGMLTAIRKCFELVRQVTGRQLTLANIPAGDTRVYDMICQADTTGVFQIESRAQMAMYAAWIQSTPYARPRLDDVLAAVQSFVTKDLPAPRGSA